MISLCVYCGNSFFIIMYHVAMETVMFCIAQMCLFLETYISLLININITLLKKGVMLGLAK